MAAQVLRQANPRPAPGPAGPSPSPAPALGRPPAQAPGPASRPSTQAHDPLALAQPPGPAPSFLAQLHPACSPPSASSKAIPEARCRIFEISKANSGRDARNIVSFLGFEMRAETENNSYTFGFKAPKFAPNVS